MKDFILDANAVLLYFKDANSGGGAVVRSLSLQAQRNQAHLLMSVINMGEVLYVLIRDFGEQRAMHYIQLLQHIVTIIEADVSQTIEAAKLKHQYNLGYADSFAAALALSLKATLVSSDPDFEKLGKSLKWMRLPGLTPKRR